MLRVTWAASSACVLMLIGTCWILVSYGFVTATLVVGSILVLCVLYLLPVATLPSVALALFVLIPVGYVPSVPPVIGRYLSPAILVVAIWTLRSLRRRTPRSGKVSRPWTLTSIGLLALAALSTLWSIDPLRTLLWSATTGLALLAPALLASRSDETSRHYLIRTWLWLGAGIGLMAIVEGATGQTFLGALYSNPAGVGIGVNQNWSSIRATTTLGHPLMNGTFLASTAAFGIMSAIKHRSRLAGLSGGLATVGAVFTVSRSAVAGLLSGLIIGVVLILSSKHMTLTRKLLWSLVSILIAVAAAASPLISERSASAEGSSSAETRGMLLDMAIEIAGVDGYTGSGAGSSQPRATQAGLSLSIENSYGGVLVSLGVLGLVLFVSLVLGLVVAAARRPAPEIAASVVAFAVSAAAYPLVDNVPTALILLGLLANLLFSQSRQPTGLATQGGHRKPESHGRLRRHPVSG